MYSGVFTFLVEAVGFTQIGPRPDSAIDFADQYPVYAASALAANSFARSYFAAAFPLFGVQMYNSKCEVSGPMKERSLIWQRSWIPVGDVGARVPCACDGPVR